MGAPDLGRLSGNNIHDIAKSQQLLQHPTKYFQFGEAQARVEKHFTGIKARFFMNFYLMGIIRSARIILPVIVGKPAVGFSQKYQLASAFVIESVFIAFFTFQYLCDSRRLPEQFLYFGDILPGLYINMGDLVVAQCKSPTGVKIQILPAQIDLKG